jgi:hypothetical protein
MQENKSWPKNCEDLIRCEQCKELYYWTKPGESLLGDLAFCGDKCCNQWIDDHGGLP